MIIRVYNSCGNDNNTILLLLCDVRLYKGNETQKKKKNTNRGVLYYSFIVYYIKYQKINKNKTHRETNTPPPP